MDLKNRSVKRASLVIGAAAILVLGSTAVSAQTAGVPEGFKPIFNGKNLEGWHLSKTNHHGSTGNAYVENGAIVLKQRPFGQGGLLLSDKKYHNFDLYLEVKEISGCNSGLFLRSTEGGSAYQIELDQTRGNGNLLGEMMKVTKPARAPDIAQAWRYDEWNSIRVRMVGDAPHITLWVNGVQMWDVEEPVNDKIAGEADGRIGLQLHWFSPYEPAQGAGNMANMWRPDAAYRFRSIAIKELP